MNLIFLRLEKISRVFLLPFILFLCFFTILFDLSFSNRSAVGEKAPHFALNDLQGNKYSLEAMKGKGIIHLTFLATWCEPCRKDYPKLNNDYDRLKSRGYILIGIGVPARQNPGKLKEFAIKENIRFPILFDSSGEVVKAYNASLPYNVIIDKKGVIVFQSNSLPSNHTEIVKELLSNEK